MGHSQFSIVRYSFCVGSKSWSRSINVPLGFNLGSQLGRSHMRSGSAIAGGQSRCPSPYYASWPMFASQGPSLWLLPFWHVMLGQISCKMKLEWHFLNVHFCSSVAKFIPMNMHVCVSAHKGNMFICQMQITGEIVLAIFCWRSFAGEELAKFYVLFFSSLKTHRNFTTNFTMHQGPKPQRIHQAAFFSPPNIFN